MLMQTWRFTSWGRLRSGATASRAAWADGSSGRCLRCSRPRWGNESPSTRSSTASGGDEPTAAARSTLQTYVSNLRAAIGDVIVRDDGGYRLAADPAQVDAV